jgi:hypothetical protein
LTALLAPDVVAVDRHTMDCVFARIANDFLRSMARKKSLHQSRRAKTAVFTFDTVEH